MNDLTGLRFGRLTVIKYTTHSRWLCKCECGNEKIVVSTDLKKGKTKSCGCLHNELISKKMSTHKLSDTRLYNIWCAMKQRCYYKKHIRYNRYGGRGIEVCDEWRYNFVNFYNWAMQNGYKEDLTLDRINNNGNYEPQNCKWSTYKEQFENQTNSFGNYKKYHKDIQLKEEN